MKGKSLIGLVLSLIIIAGTIFVAVSGIGTEKEGSAENINLGLDLAGGVSITYATVDDNPSDKDINDTIYKLQQRISSQGYTEGEVYREGSNRINVDIPNVSNPNAILEELGKPGSLQFTTEDGSLVLTGADVKDATPMQDSESLTGGYLVSLELNSEGADKFAQATGENVGKVIYIIYDGDVIMSPVVNEKITGGKAVINGMANHEEASDLASFIRIGSLKLELQELRSNIVGAKMGQDAIQSSLKAGLIGLIIVFLFMILFYRLPGFVSAIALAFYAALTISIISLADITLTLPGIAGIILSIGMAVDANVIIFSRIKEELAQNKTLRASVKAGFRKATSAIIDGNVTTLIASAVLYVMGTGTIQGFAQTLALGIVVSMFTALVATRILLISLVGLKLKNKALYGVAHQFKVFDILKRKKIWFIASAIVVVIGLGFMPVNNGSKGDGLNYDVEFAGGTSTMVTTRETIYETVEALQADVLDLVKEATGDDTPQLNTVRGTEGQGQFVIKTKTLNQEERGALETALIDKYTITAEDIQSYSISGTISGEMRRDAILAVLIAAAGMLVYITIRFHDYRYGLAAVIALLHDVLIVFAVYSVLFIPINNSFIAAMLTIVGYSINDTIVLFDRVRENQAVMKRGDFKGLVNRSISQTLNRSINTSLTTFIMVFVLNIFGVASIREFALPLMVGILSGTYSSIFIASPLWYLFKQKEERLIQKAHRADVQ